jgi:hypothetical protein
MTIFTVAFQALDATPHISLSLSIHVFSFAPFFPFQYYCTVSAREIVVNLFEIQRLYKVCDHIAFEQLLQFNDDRFSF